MRDAHQPRLGAQIAYLRERQGWSQRALAKWVGIDQSAVSRIEAGRRRLSAAELQRFADALHVSADELLKGEPDAPAVAGPAPGAATSPPLQPPAARRGLPMLSQVASDLVTRDDAAGAPPAGAGAYAQPAPPLARAAGADFPPHARAATVHSAAAESAAGVERPRLAGLPVEVAEVARDWSLLRGLAEAPEPAQRWSTGHSAEGRPERIAHAVSPHPGAAAPQVLYDRVARFWRSELHVDPDEGPLPDLVPLLEDGYGAQVVVARVAGASGADSALSGAPAVDRPVAAAFTDAGVPFIFVNAARPVVLQRFALAHAFAHLVLGHGDVVDHRIEWSRNVPPEAAANDFAEELLAPVRAVQRWYERRPAARSVSLDDLLDLANAFGISAWAALYRSRAAQRLQGKQYHVLKAELQRHEWELLPRQAYLGGLRDTLAYLTPSEALPAGEYGGPAVLRVPAAMRAWALADLRGGRLSLEDAAALLHLAAGDLALQLARLGLE